MKKILLAFLLFFFSLPLLYSQNLNLRFNTFFYGWERSDALADTSGTESKTFHIRGYQNLLLEASKNKWSFNTLIQTEEDVAGKISSDSDKYGFDYRFYNLYIKGTNLFDVLDIKLGRQHIFAGAGRGSIDGLFFKVKAGKNKEFQLSGFGGALTPYDYTFESHYKAKENYMFGGQLAYFGVKDLMVSLSYANKHRKLPSYYAIRPDSLFNQQEVLIDIDTPAEQLAGLDFNYTLFLKHNFYGKAYYDFNLKKFYRGEFNARINAAKNLNFSVGYTYRQPQFAYNTIFWVFNHKQNQEIEGGVDYTLKNGMNLFARAANVFYEDDNSLRIQAGFNHANYGLNFVRYMGYSGESDGVNGYYIRQIVPEKLSASANVSFSNYRLGDYDSEKVTSLSGVLGFAYRPNRQFTIDVQGQFIKNRIYKLDTRFLLGFSYWLFKKF